MQINIFLIQPLIIPAAAAILLMLAVALRRNHTFAFIFTLFSLVVSFVSLFEVAPYTPVKATPLLIIDGYALFYMGLIYAASFAITLLSYGYFKKFDERKEEFYILLLFSTLGSAVMASSSHLVSFFLGLEILSIPLYILISYLRTKERSLEAGIKYIVLAGISSAFLLFGMALIYAEFGTMEFEKLAHSISSTGTLTPLALTGFAMMIVGVGFKLSVAPFHMWASDVYEGAPAPVSSFIASVSKGGMFAVWLRFFVQLNGYKFHSLIIALSVIAVLSMFAGNILALLQKNVKRILAYSSIAHLGYLLVSFIAGGKMGVHSATFYLVAYSITIIGAFGVVSILSAESRDADNLEDYRGLFWKRPVIAIVFAAMLFSLAGIPLTAGFVGKFFIVAAGINSSQWALAIFLVVNSAIGIYYYLKIVAAMFSQPEELTVTPDTYKIPVSIAGALALTGLSVLLIYYGVYPAGIMDVIARMM
jgi:NADH-quinone oxidoreductase subunit N